MSLPKNCLYTNNINAAYSRNYNNNIAPQNGMGPYGAGETIIINIPTARNLVMSGADSLLKFSLTVTAAAATLWSRLDKAGAHSVIQRVRVFHGSTLLSDIDNYNNLVGMMMSLQLSPDAAKGKHSILSGLESESVTAAATVTTQNARIMNLRTGVRLNGYDQAAATATSPVKTFAIPIMNFLSYSDKYIPLFAMTGAPLRIEIQLVSQAIQAVNSETAASSMSLTDVEYICNFMEISDNGMSLINGALGGGPLKWVVQDYRNYSTTVALGAATPTELPVPIPAKFTSLRSLFNSFRQNPAGAVGRYALNSNHFGMTDYTYRLGSRTVPTKAPRTLPEFFGELIRAVGCVSDLNHEPSINIESYNVKAPVVGNVTVETLTLSSPTSNTNSFYTGLDLESYSNASLDSVYNGYNSSTDDIFFVPKFTHDANANVRIDTYAYYDQVVILENGFASVQY